MNRFLIILFTISLAITSLIGQDSLNMRKMSNIDTLGTRYDDVWGYTWQGKEYAVVGSNTAINVIDVTDCGNPTVEYQWKDGSNTLWRDFKDHKDYIYAVCDVSCNEGLQVINKNTLDTFQSTTEFSKAHNIFIDHAAERLYVAGADGTHTGLWVYDLKENPHMPDLLAEIDFRDWDGVMMSTINWYVHDVYVRNDTAYCSHGYKGHANWDMSDLNNIILLGEFEGPGYNHSSWTHDDLPLEYVAREVPAGLDMQVYDISDMSDISVVKAFSHTIHTPTGSITQSRPHNPYYHNDRLFVSCYHDGVKVFDLSDPTDPQILAYYDTYDLANGYYNDYQGNWGVYPYLPSGCILASDLTFGFFTMKMLVPPTRDVEIETTDIIIEKDAGAIYFATSDSKIWKLFVSSGGNILKSLVSSASPSPIEVINANLSFTTASTGIYLKDINGNYYKLEIDDSSGSGVLITTLTLPVDLPTTAVRIVTEDIYLSQYGAGMKMKGASGVCYMARIIAGGGTEVTPCD